jgi:hypothetical protein
MGRARRRRVDPLAEQLQLISRSLETLRNLQPAEPASGEAEAALAKAFQARQIHLSKHVPLALPAPSSSPRPESWTSQLEQVGIGRLTARH